MVHALREAGLCSLLICLFARKGIWRVNEMGIGELLGIKSAKLNLKGNYETVDALYEAIKGIKFEAGVPALVKHGFNQVIVFPELDRNNQVWIMDIGKGKYQVMRSSEVAGVGNVLKNAILDDLTDGLTSMSGAFGNKKKRCMELVDITAKEIEQAGV